MRTILPRRFHVAALAILPILLVTASAQAGGISWSKLSGLDELLEEAKKENKVLFFALNMDGERANERMLDEHYKSSRLGKLSKHTINVFCTVSKDRKIPGVSVEQQNQNDIDLRTRVLKASPDEWIVAPQHIWVAPDGKVLSSVPYFIRELELEWAWVEAIKKHDPKFQWKLDEAARAPERLRLDGQASRGKGDDKPPSPEEVEKALDEIRKSGRGGWRKLRENWNKILRSESERAISMAEEFLRGGWGGEERKVRTIETIGKHSPAVWAPIIEPYVDDKSEEMRKAAVTALGELRNPKSSRVLSKALRNRKETDAVRGRILRAMAKIDPESSKLAREIGKALGPKNEENLRAHATLAAAKLERRKDVTKWLSTALSDPSPLVGLVAEPARPRDPHQNSPAEQPAGRRLRLRRRVRQARPRGPQEGHRGGDDRLAGLVARRLGPLRPALHPHGVAQRRHLPRDRRPRRRLRRHAALRAAQQLARQRQPRQGPAAALAGQAEVRPEASPGPT
jgi:hypothetical protein